MDQLISRNSRSLLGLIVILIMVFVSAYSYFHAERGTKQLITVATGEPTSESYQIMSAVAQVVNNENMDFYMKIISTQGGVENTLLLEENLVQLATLPANLKISNNTRLVAKLDEYVFHFIFQANLYFDNIEKVNGIKVAVPTQNSAQYMSFIQLRDHFGLDENKVSTVVTSWKSAVWLFKNKDIDAVFRVRSANNPEIKKFINETGAHCEPITQSEAISLDMPMFQKSIIPRGVYSGIPANPPENIETLGVDRLLVATKKTPDFVVNEIASILFTRRRELIGNSKLVVGSSIPSENSLIPWHQGLVDFVNKEEPNFIQQNAEFLALILSVILLIGSSSIQILNRNKQQRLNAYNEQLLAIKVNVEQTRDMTDLMKLREEHYALVNQIVGDAVQGKISSDGFEFFTFGWDSVTSLILEKEKSIRNVS
jgi:TRAP transporter TAXI family solute receptor